MKRERSIFNQSTLGGNAVTNRPPDPIPCHVLDPFAGAGTTGLVAEKLGRDSVLVDINPEYAKMSKERILNELGSMFTGVSIEKAI